MGRAKAGSNSGQLCGLFLLLLPATLIAVDVSVLFVAGPAIAAALHPSSRQWLWAMDIYGFVLASLLITMGSLGDRFGRRRVLLAGAALFGGGSAAVAYAPSVGWLIAARAVMAVGGATLAPSTLSLIKGMFCDDRRRGRAVAAWTIAFAGGAITGPIVGGVLLAHLWWGSVFLINVPVAALLLIAGPIVIPEQKSPNARRPDMTSIAASLAAVLCLVYALTRGSDTHHFEAPTIIAIMIGVAAAAVFIRRQRHTSNPLIELSLLRRHGYGYAIGANTLVAMVTAGVGLLAFPFMQLVHALTPLQSALYALPTLAGAFTGPVVASTLITRWRPIAVLIAGLFIAAAGLTILSLIATNTTLWLFVGGYVLLTFGTGISATTGNALVLAGAPPGHVGAASGLSETSNQLGSALGIAALGTVADTIYRSTLAHTPAADGHHPWQTAAGAIGLARSHSGTTTTTLDAVRHAYTTAITTTALAAAVITGATALCLTIALRVRRSTPSCPAPAHQRNP